MLSLKCGQPCANYPVICNVGLRLYFQVFSSSQRDRKFGFLNLALAELLNSSQSMVGIENW